MWHIRMRSTISKVHSLNFIVRSYLERCLPVFTSIGIAKSRTIFYWMNTIHPRNNLIILIVTSDLCFDVSIPGTLRITNIDSFIDCMTQKWPYSDQVKRLACCVKANTFLPAATNCFYQSTVVYMWKVQVAENWP